VPDCLKSAVSRACRYEPELNPTYADMASHYGVSMLSQRYSNKISWLGDS
jgi:hypothetical protein